MSISYNYWQDGELWLGYLEEHPDYLTQGGTLQELEEHLQELQKDLSPGIVASAG